MPIIPNSSVANILFINPISTDIVILILEGDIYKEKVTIPKGDDFVSFPDKIISLVEFHGIEEVWCICGP